MHTYKFVYYTSKQHKSIINHKLTWFFGSLDFFLVLINMIYTTLKRSFIIPYTIDNKRPFKITIFVSPIALFDFYSNWGFVSIVRKNGLVNILQDFTIGLNLSCDSLDSSRFFFLFPDGGSSKSELMLSLLYICLDFSMGWSLKYHF